MTALTSPAGAPLDQTRRCPGCSTRVPLTDDWCDRCWTRLPFHVAVPVSTYFRRDENGYRLAVHNAREWLKANPRLDDEDDQQPELSALARQLHDQADMLDGIGQHATHTRRHEGRVVVCSCGVSVTRSGS